MCIPMWVFELSCSLLVGSEMYKANVHPYVFWVWIILCIMVKWINNVSKTWENTQAGLQSACNCEKGAEVRGKEKSMRASLLCSRSQGRKFARQSTICVSVSSLRPPHPHPAPHPHHLLHLSPSNCLFQTSITSSATSSALTSSTPWFWKWGLSLVQCC